MHSEEELLARARQGDRRAFSELVEKYKGEVAMTVVSMLGRSSDVDDVVQDVFIRFYHAMDKFRGDASVKTFLTRIAMNRSLDIIRRRKNVVSRFLSRDDEAIHIPEPVASAEGEIESTERAIIVHGAIQSLPPKQRAVVVLRLVEGYSTAETATLLGIRFGTVLSRLSRGLDRLRTMLEPYFGDEIRIRGA